MWYNAKTTLSSFFGIERNSNMSEKRKDSRGRVLRNGETQRSDGMYMYRYNDAGGVRRTVYSWRLVETDKVPPRKKACEPLREIEKRLNRDADDGIHTFVAKKKTLNDFFADYMGMRPELKPSTRAGYFYMYNQYVSNSLGLENIGNIKYSDVKKFYLSLLTEKEISPNSIECINTVLHPVFTLAVRDGYIRINPSHGVLSELKKKYDWSKPKRHALTVEQQEAFVDYVRESPKYNHYLPLFTVFLGTGCRVGEITGLRWEDCDFSGNTISINHNLVYCKTDDGKHRKFYISTPKTEAGKRVIPMFSEVKKALLHERIEQMKTGFCQTEIDGYTGFIFMGARGNIRKATDINKALVRIVRDYNEEETELAKKQHREPALLPHFSVHNLRHTFCTRLCEHETNLKVIQEIMGHANISITMDVYNEVTQEQKRVCMANLEGKIKIS